MEREDIEGRGDKGVNLSAERSNWLSWLVPIFILVNIAVFVVEMYVNNCPKRIRNRDYSFGVDDDKCVARFIGRFSSSHSWIILCRTFFFSLRTAFIGYFFCCLELILVGFCFWSFFECFALLLSCFAAFEVKYVLNWLRILWVDLVFSRLELRFFGENTDVSFSSLLQQNLASKTRTGRNSDIKPSRMGLQYSHLLRRSDFWD